MPRTFEENLALYAELTVKEGVNLQPGQELLLSADIGDAALVRLIVKEAYKVGAKNVAVQWSDETTTLTRFQEGSDEAIAYAPQWQYDSVARAMSENAARLVVFGGDPSLLSKVKPERVAISSKAQGLATKALSEYIGGFLINWCIVGSAAPAWAKQVFPGLPTDEAVAKLWDAIFLTSRVLEDNPIAAWVAHCENIEQRMAWLNELRFDAVHLHGPGTDLRVGLVENHEWIAGRSHAKNGVRCSPNIPTEEVFTMPHRLRAEGTVRSTKPLSVRGQLVDGIEVEFKDGAVVTAKAKKGEETLQRLLDTDEGSRRLGELALVPNTSGVSRAGILFLNTLYDENAASHIALGRALGENLKGYGELTEEQRLEHGVNDSLIHIDWMIGSPEIDVDGIRPDGTPHPIMRSGEWV